MARRRTQSAVMLGVFMRIGPSQSSCAGLAAVPWVLLLAVWSLSHEWLL